MVCVVNCRYTCSSYGQRSLVVHDLTILGKAFKIDVCLIIVVYERIIRELVKFIYWKNSNNCSPVISQRSYDLDNKFYVEKQNFSVMKKMFFPWRSLCH